MKIAYGEPKTFYSKSKKLITNINGIIDEYQPQGIRLSVRQIYYQCVSRGFLNNNAKQYGSISNTVTNARLAGLIDWDAIEDRTRYIRENSHWNSPKEIIEIAAEQYKIDTRATQPYYIECWIEKDSLVSILETTCRRLDVACFSCRGFPSITALREAALRFEEKGKPGIILYAGDHDPSGLEIPTTIQEYMKIFNANVELRRIGITLEQIHDLKLPPFPAKDKDGNYKKYVQRTGIKTAWELDALPPEKLSELFEKNIAQLTDYQLLRTEIEREKQDKIYFSKWQQLS